MQQVHKDTDGKLMHEISFCTRCTCYLHPKSTLLSSINFVTICAIILSFRLQPSNAFQFVFERYFQTKSIKLMRGERREKKNNVEK